VTVGQAIIGLQRAPASFRDFLNLSGQFSFLPSPTHLDELLLAAGNATTVKAVNFGNNGFGYAHMQVICKFLAADKKIVQLNLEDNKFGYESLELLLHCIYRQNSTLELVSLRRNAQLEARIDDVRVLLKAFYASKGSLPPNVRVDGFENEVVAFKHRTALYN
jgi:hypothetical protein